MPIKKKTFNFYCCFVKNEAALSKFVNKAYSKFLKKNLKKKPECVPDLEVIFCNFWRRKGERKKKPVGNNQNKGEQRAGGVNES